MLRTSVGESSVSRSSCFAPWRLTAAQQGLRLAPPSPPSSAARTPATSSLGVAVSITDANKQVKHVNDFELITWLVIK